MLSWCRDLSSPHESDELILTCLPFKNEYGHRIQFCTSNISRRKKIRNSSNVFDILVHRTVGHLCDRSGDQFRQRL